MVSNFLQILSLHSWLFTVFLDYYVSATIFSHSSSGQFLEKTKLFFFEIIWINLKLKIVLHRHWKPMNKICSFCSRTYDYILRYEHLTMETQQFLKYLNLDHIIPPTVNFQIYFCNKRYSLLSFGLPQLLIPTQCHSSKYSVCCYG